MRKLRKVVPFGLAVMMSLQGIYPAVPVMADTVKVAAAKKTTSLATVLNKKERAKIMQQINAMSSEEGLKLAKKKGIIKEDTNAKESNLKKATANKDAKEGEVGYQFTQDQYVDETHRIRYEYIITAEGEVSADYVNGVIYENGSPKVNYLDEVQTYEINDKLTYPSEVTLNGTTYQVKSALFHNTTAKHVIVPEGVESCMGCSSATDMEILTIPSTLKKIGSGFRSCPSSHNYYDSGFLDTRNNATFKGYEMTNPKKAKYLTVKDGIVYNKEETEMLTKVPCALEKDTLVLPDTIKEIPEGAFMSNKTVKKVVFGKNITFIGNGAFAYSNIENVQMNDSVTVLDEYAFYYCTKLANVDLSKSLTKIDGYETFKYTAALKHINLKNVTELTGWYTFQQSGLEDVDLSNVSNLAGVQQFVYCRDLRNVYIGKDTDFTNDVGMGVNLFYGCTALENYAEKEKNQHHLYVENGRLYASEMKGSFKTENDGDFVDKLYKGKILVGYSIKQQINDVKNGTLKIDDDITGIAMGGAPVSSDLKKGTNNLKDVNTYFSKLIIPSSVEVIDTINTLPVSNLEIDFYGNEIPTIGSIVSQTQYGAEEDSAVLGTKTLNFKTDALKEKYDKSWKYQTLDVYMNEKIILAVLPEKKTTSLSLNKTSDKILCDGNSHEIHLIAKLSEDDCTDVVTFKSSNEDLATVDGNGVVTTKENAHGTATITATAGNHTATYKLTQAGSGIDVTADQKTIVYKEWWETENLLDNIKQSIHVTCADCHNNLRRDKDYEVIVSDYKKTGKVDVTIKGIGAFEGMTAKTSVNVEYHKHGEQGYRIDNLYSGYNWTGKEVKPDVTIRCADCNKELKEGTDYKLEYKNNVNVGTATVKVVGMGAYEGVDQTANFEIEEDCGWNGIAVNDNVYQDGDHIGTYKWSRWKENGNLPTVVIVCKHCGKWLTKDTDYKLEYSNKDHPGDGTLKVTGLNKYAGYELNFKYTLSPKTFYSNEHSDGDDLGTFRYTGKAIKADIGTLYIENTDTEAVKGKDYQLEYSNNIEEGTATVKVVGIGDAKGTVLTYTYHIEKQHGWNGFYSKGHKDGESLGTFKWTGNNILIDPDMRCSHCDKELQENVDYKVEYSNNIDPGVASMKIIGMGDYKGYELNFTFVIEKKAPTTTEDQKPTTTTETKPTTGTTENSSATSETKPTTGTTAVTTTTTEDKTTTTTESKPTTEDKTTATTESKPTISSTTTETKPSTGTSSTSGTTTAEKETATTAAPVIRISVKKAAIQKIKALKKAFTINILKNKDQVTGYQISYSYKKNFKGQKIKDLKKFKYKKIKVKRKKYTIVSYKVKGLKRKKTAYIRVRAYKQVGKTKVYGKWSSVKKVKIK